MSIEIYMVEYKGISTLSGKDREFEKHEIYYLDTKEKAMYMEQSFFNPVTHETQWNVWLQPFWTLNGLIRKYKKDFSGKFAQDYFRDLEFNVEKIGLL